MLLGLLAEIALASVALSLGATWVSAQQSPSASGSPLRYDIEAKLDPVAHRLDARERIHIVNTSQQPLTQLYFHLYLNAFRDRHSVFMREGGARLRGHDLGRPGSIAISELRTADGADLLPGLETELVPGDRTQVRVQLPAALPPGAALDLALAFQAELPELMARSGYAGEFHMLGQWFPKLAKLEPSGEFASFPYHGFGEFYADFADYDVTIAVPERFIVASAGVLSERTVRAGVRRERYRSEHVHDSAWAAYPYFETLQRTVGRVRMQLFAPRGYGAALARQAEVLAHALPYFEARYGEYPYTTLTVILPPPAANAASGMEYPTLFTSSGPFWALPLALPDPAHDIVSVHELAHQWFSGMIASNEVAYPVLDEGLAEWAALDFLREYYRRPGAWTAHVPLPQGPFDVLRAAILARTKKSLPSSLLSVESYSDKTLGVAVYARPALVLARIAERHGRAPLRAALSRYARAQRFHHPTPDDLFRAFDATPALGVNYGQRVLRKALASESADPPVLQLPAALRKRSPSGWQFLPELWAVAFHALRSVGP
ncbi:MAG: hypothetical protein RL701_4025 [Pseudomonadota bacterium]